MSKLAAIVLAFVVVSTGPKAEENRGSANHMLPLCKSWLQIASQDLAAVTNELKTGNARPGGMVQHLTTAGMCAGMVIGIVEALRMYDMICPPQNITNEQLVRMAVNQIERHPEQMHEDFIVPVATRLIITWPCPK